MDRVDRWLHETRNWIRWFPEPGEESGHLPRAQSGLDALVAAGALDAGSAEAWRARFTAGHEPPDDASAEQRAAGEALLRELPRESARGYGAALLLGRAGVVDDEDDDDDEIVDLTPALIDLVAVLATPGGRRGELRLLYGLRFKDGLRFVADRDWQFDMELEFPNWTLRDDPGTEYRHIGGGGGGRTEQIDFVGAVPPGAVWLELALDDVTFRVEL